MGSTNPLIIPVFLSHDGCPHECLFCSRKATAPGGPALSTLPAFIGDSLRQLPSHSRKRERQIAFYGATFTALDEEDQISYLIQSRPFVDQGLIDSLSISTRPDALSRKGLALLRDHKVKTVEIGVQSMRDEVLMLSKRGHSAAKSTAAIRRLKQSGFEVGVQLMIGLPGDRLEYFLDTIDRVVRLRPDFVRIHPTLVLKESPLEILWSTGQYTPLTLDQAIRWLKLGILRLEKASVPIARIGLQATRELEDHYLAGPYHPSLNHCVRSALALDTAARLLESAGAPPRPVFFCHPREVSHTRGLRNENLLKLREQFDLEEVIVRPRADLPQQRLVLQTPVEERWLDRRDLYDRLP